MAATYSDLPLGVLLRACALADYRTLAMWSIADPTVARSRCVREELRRVSRVLADLSDQKRFTARFGVGCVAGGEGAGRPHRENPFAGEEGGLDLCRAQGCCSVCPLVIEADSPEYRVCEEARPGPFASPFGRPPPAVSLRPVARFPSLLDLLSFLRTSRFAQRACTDPRTWGLVREPLYEQAVAKPGGVFVYRYKPQCARGGVLGLAPAGPPVVPHKRWNEGWGGFWDVDCTTEWMEESLENWLRFLLLPFYEEPPRPSSEAQQQPGGVGGGGRESSGPQQGVCFVGGSLQAQAQQALSCSAAGGGGPSRGGAAAFEQ